MQQIRLLSDCSGFDVLINQYWFALALSKGLLVSKLPFPLLLISSKHLVKGYPVICFDISADIMRLLRGWRGYLLHQILLACETIPNSWILLDKGASFHQLKFPFFFKCSSGFFAVEGRTTA